MLEYNSKVLTYGNKWLEEDLSCSVPPGVFRFAFSDPYFDPLKYGQGGGSGPFHNGDWSGTRVQWRRVSGKPNVWDCILTNPYGGGVWAHMFDQAFGSSYSHTPFVCDVAMVAGNFNYSDAGPSATTVASMFGNNYSLKSVSNLTFRAGQETSIFYHSENIESAYLPNVNNTTSLSGMFDGVGLKHVKIGDLSNITDMFGTFAGNPQLERIELHGTQNVTDWGWTFSGCSHLNSVYIESTASATRTAAMFDRCTSLRTVQDFDTSHVTNMRNMFSGCRQLQRVPDLDTSIVTDVTRMFDCCYEARGIQEFYAQLVNQANPPTSYYCCFRQCSTLSWRKSIDWEWGGLVNANKWTFTASVGSIDVRDKQYVVGPTANAGVGACNILQIEQDGSNYYYYTAADDVQNGYTAYVTLDVHPVQEITRYALTGVELKHVLHSCRELFRAGALTSAVTFDVSSCSDFGAMFYEHTYLEAVPLFTNIMPSADMTNMFAGCYNVASGALDLYNSVKDNHTGAHFHTFYNCGGNTVSGAAELVQIPTSWGGLAT